MLSNTEAADDTIIGTMYSAILHILSHRFCRSAMVNFRILSPPFLLCKILHRHIKILGQNHQLVELGFASTGFPIR